MITSFIEVYPALNERAPRILVLQNVQFQVKISLVLGVIFREVGTCIAKTRNPKNNESIKRVKKKVRKTHFKHVVL